MNSKAATPRTLFCYSKFCGAGGAAIMSIIVYLAVFNSTMTNLNSFITSVVLGILWIEKHRSLENAVIVCIPLKSCLQVWSCVKSIVDLSLAVFLTLMVMILDSYHELKTKHFTLAHAFLIVIIVLVIDCAFMVVLAVGLFTNNLRTLRVFLCYSIYMVFMGAACFIGFLIYGLIDIYDTSSGQVLVIVIMVCGLINAVLDVCIIFTLKSEMIKLRNKQQYEFVQMPTLSKDDEEASQYVEPFQADVENLDGI